MFSEQCGAQFDVYGPSLGQSCSGGAYVLFMSLLDALLRNTCEVTDATGRITPTIHPDLEYDFVVIGSGTGGSTVAGRLAEVDHWKILLLEAGGDEPVGTQVPSFSFSYLNSDIDWQFRTEPEPVACQGFAERRCSWPRGKVLGGTSVINGMMFLRGTRKDYQRWAEAGNPDWSFDKILADFKATEDNSDRDLVDEEYHGFGGPLTIGRYRYQPPFAWDVLKAGEQIGYNVSNDLNGERFNGFAVAQMNSRKGMRLSLAKAFLRPHRSNPNLHIMLNSTATKILLHAQGASKRASAVEFAYKGQMFTVRASKEIILSAGAVQTPQLLLLSGIGDKETLDAVGIEQVHDLPAVGKGLQNHVSFELVASINQASLNSLNMETVSEYVRNQSGPMSSTGLAQVTARVHSEQATPDDPDIQFYFFGLGPKCAKSGLSDELTDDNQTTHVSIYPTYLHSKSKGYLGLHSKDPFAPPKIVANYLTAEEDVIGLRAGIRIAQRLINSPILREKYDMRLEKDSYGSCSEQHEWDSDDFWECAIKVKTGHENHQGSSCKMGRRSDPESCVNQQLQLYGVDSLRVIDASVFPTLPSANPQASIVMVAERGARFIKEHYLNRVRRK
ncbi:glucose dehydrogenase [FAD, quinone] [Dendroctonus ponderosae]|nr:glucose dehydrogenase [FAD, quinone] [Dendroctonus ponderosae]